MDRLAGVRLKVERAKKHIIDLEMAVSGFCQSKPYAIGVKPHRVSEIDNVTLFVEGLQDIPSHIPLILGDAVHNLRSALDHLAGQLVLGNGETPTRDTEFPICDPAKEYTSAFAKRKVKGMSVGAKELIREMQPRNSGDHTLWNLHSLDIADKHRLLITAQLASQDWGVNASGSGHYFWFNRLSFALVIGEEITNLPRATYAGQKHEDFQLALDIAFGQSEIVRGEPVLGTLNQIEEFTSGVVSKFERFVI
jgi:hypothetical protein